MKAKSINIRILILCFALCTASTFKYAYDRTDGNLVMSIMFTMQCLLLKAGLVEPIIVNKYEPPQLDQPRQVVERLLPDYMAEEGFYERPLRVCMGKNENKVSTISPHYSHSVRTVTEIRAGMSSDDLREAAKLLIAVWIGTCLQNAGGFSIPPSLLKKHPRLQAANDYLFGKPRQNGYATSSGSNSGYRVPTQLEMDSRCMSELDMHDQYQKFLLVKHPNTNCSQERFTQLCSDPQRLAITENSIKEAVIILECEGRGLVDEVERPNLANGEPNLDFRTNGPNGIRYVDVKEPRSGRRGNTNLDSAARRMGHKIHKQKNGQSPYGVSSQEILHIVNMELLDPSLRSDYQKNIFLPHGSKNIIILDITQRN